MAAKIHKKIIKSPLRPPLQYVTLDSRPAARCRRWKNRKTLSGGREKMGGFSLLDFIYHIDQSIMLWLQDVVRNPLLSKLLVPLTTIGYAGTLWIILSIVMLFFRKTRKVGWLSLLTMLVCYLFNDILLKELVQRPRPFMDLPQLQVIESKPTSWSFPSGHACSSFAAASTYSKGEEPRWLKGLFWFLAVAMTFSRPYVGVHYPSDVLAGACIGLLGSALMWRFTSEPYDRLTERIAQKRHA
jgi:undecaprenyl-diphosphatase